MTPHHALAQALAAAVCCLAAAVPAAAQDVALAGRMGDKALLVVQGRSVVLGVGQTQAGVRFVRWDGEAAVVEQSGGQVRLRVGAAPARVGEAGSGAPTRSASEIVIPVGPGGHFVTAGSINGQSVRFLVDTGATLISLSRAEATRLGLDLKGARGVLTQTAAGVAPGQVLMLQRVRVGDVEVYNVQALVGEAPMPFILLGNSFLERFQWRRENDVMRLQRR
jgi:aspartyl protease family protein